MDTKLPSHALIVSRHSSFLIMWPFGHYVLLVAYHLFSVPLICRTFSSEDCGMRVHYVHFLPRPADARKQLASNDIKPRLVQLRLVAVEKLEHELHNDLLPTNNPTAMV